MTRTEDRLTAALTARAEQVTTLTPARLPDAQSRRLTPGRVGALVAITAAASSGLTAVAVAGTGADEKSEPPQQASPVLESERLVRDLDGDGRDDAIVLGEDDVLTVELASGGAPSMQLRRGSALLGITRYDGDQAAVVRNGAKGRILIKTVVGDRLVDPEPEDGLVAILGGLQLIEDPR